jgi:hypothetical protein
MTGSNEEWRMVPGASRYEATAGSPGVPAEVRNMAGRIIATGRNNRGYPTVTLSTDDGKRGPVLKHIVVLTAWRGKRPLGHQGCHLDDDPDHCWLSNLVWGTPAENEAHKAANGNAAPPKPSYPCLNAPQCDGKSLHPGKRCTSCVHQAGIDIAVRLGRRENLQAIADEYGFGVDWAWRLACQHGSWAGSKSDALRQQPPLSRRVMTRLRSRRVTPGGGDGA